MWCLCETVTELWMERETRAEFWCVCCVCMTVTMEMGQKHSPKLSSSQHSKKRIQSCSCNNSSPSPQAHATTTHKYIHYPISNSSSPLNHTTRAPSNHHTQPQKAWSAHENPRRPCGETRSNQHPPQNLPNQAVCLKPASSHHAHSLALLAARNLQSSTPLPEPTALGSFEDARSRGPCMMFG